MTIFFTADTHFNHKNIIKFCNRPFVDANEMNEGIIAHWNSVVTPNDVVFHLGDFLFGDRSHFMDFWQRLNGQKMLIAGNHDVRVPETVRVRDYHEIRVGDQLVVLSHFPFLSWNEMERGSYHLHGHLHGDRGDVRSERSLDVGLDSHNRMRLWSWEEVNSRLSKLPIMKRR